MGPGCCLNFRIQICIQGQCGVKYCAPNHTAWSQPGSVQVVKVFNGRYRHFCGVKQMTELNLRTKIPGSRRTTDGTGSRTTSSLYLTMAEIKSIFILKLPRGEIYIFKTKSPSLQASFQCRGFLMASMPSYSTGKTRDLPLLSKSIHCLFRKIAESFIFILYVTSNLPLCTMLILQNV